MSDEKQDLLDTPLGTGIERLMKWVGEDFGESIYPALVADLMLLTRERPDISLLDIITHVALDYSK